jgi:hypothetical protein
VDTKLGVILFLIDDAEETISLKNKKPSRSRDRHNLFDSNAFSEVNLKRREEPNESGERKSYFRKSSPFFLIQMRSGLDVNCG